MSVRTEAARSYYEQFKDAERPMGGSDIGTEAQERVVYEAVNNAYAYPHTPGYCEAWVEAVYRGAGINVPYMGLPVKQEMHGLFLHRCQIYL